MLMYVEPLKFTFHFSIILCEAYVYTAPIYYSLNPKKENISGTKSYLSCYVKRGTFFCYVQP